ncbi:MAG: hypothetical protein RLZ35_1174 [Pseudomonadota bacterium]|jgi:hypothetical protein
MTDNNSEDQEKHFSTEDEKSFFDALEKGDLTALEKKFETAVTNAENKIEAFIGSIATLTASEDVKSQVEGARSAMKSEFTKIKTWFTAKMAELKGQPADDLPSKLKVFKEECLVQWADLKKYMIQKTKGIKALMPGAKKPGIDAEAVILKTQTTINEVVVPTLKNLFAISKAATLGAIKGVKEMQKNKDDSDKKS